MPNALIKSFSTRYKVPRRQVEALWNRIARDLEKEGYTKDDKVFYRNLVGRMKRHYASRSKQEESLRHHRYRNSAVQLHNFFEQYYAGYDGIIDIPSHQYHYLPPTHDYSRQELYAHAKDLEHLFRSQNPRLLQQLKNALSDGDWAFLTKKLAQGAFWTAALYSQPVIIGLGLGLRQLHKNASYEKQKKEFLDDHRFDR